jgi:hypothetical protein
MTMNVGRVLKIGSLVIAAVVVGGWAVSYHTFEFKGGLGIQDSGFFSYPRYHAQLGDVPIWQDGTHQFTVHGLPPARLDLTLVVSGATDADRESLTSLSTSVNASIVEEGSGTSLCAATDRFPDVRNRGGSSWVLSSSTTSASFWHPSCQQILIRRFKSYTITVTVSGTNDRSQHRMLRVVLQGGGNELP